MGHLLVATEIIDLLLQLSHVVSADVDRVQLTPSQWTALRYFSRANKSSRTVSGLAAYQATTTGTTSQTVRSLETLRLLSRAKNNRDGRSSVFTLTERGRTTLAHDPLSLLAEEIGDLDEQQRQHFRELLRHLVAFAGFNRRHAFGTCRDCIFMQPRRRNEAERDGKVLYCRHLDQRILDVEKALLCQFFEGRY